MRREHFDRLQPVCPACRALGREPRPLAIGTVIRSEGDDILEGALVCSERMCQREHPIVDGIAVVVANVMSWASRQLDGVLRRDDLSPFMESMLGDAAGQGGGFDNERRDLGAYGWSHWGDLSGDAPAAREGSFSCLLETALATLDGPPRGMWIDIGCSVGRATLELARRTGDLAVGVDLNFSMLRLAERVRRQGRAIFPKRRVGLVYDRFDFAIPDVPGGHMSYWCCDAGALPFPDSTFAGALSLNLVDVVPSPTAYLIETGRVLSPGAAALLSTPYDWTQSYTPIEQWLGGHSQRGESRGSSAAELRRILSPGAPAGVDTGLVIVSERDRVPWRVPVNERASMDYAVHLLRLERNSS